MRLKGKVLTAAGVVAVAAALSITGVSMASAEGTNSTTYGGDQLNSTGTFRYDAEGTDADITIESEDIYKVNKAVNNLGEAVVNVTYEAPSATNNNRGVVTFAGGGVR